LSVISNPSIHYENNSAYWGAIIFESMTFKLTSLVMQGFNLSLGLILLGSERLRNVFNEFTVYIIPQVPL
jgi:hypothetical protein